MDNLTPIEQALFAKRCTDKKFVEEMTKNIKGIVDATPEEMKCLCAAYIFGYIHKSKEKK